jgi:two-component system OmpR family response regulator
MIDDNQHLNIPLRSHLTKQGFVVHVQRAIPGASSDFSEIMVDIVMIIAHERVDASNLVFLLRQIWRTVPIAVIKESSSTIERIEAFRRGADEFLSRQVDFEELVERIWSIHRRGPRIKQELRFGDLRFDPRNRQGWVNRQPFVVGRREAALLEILVENPEQSILRKILQQSVYTIDDGIGSNALDVVVHKLRRLLLTLNSRTYIRTIRLHGYALCLREESATEQTKDLS